MKRFWCWLTTRHETRKNLPVTEDGFHPCRCGGYADLEAGERHPRRYLNPYNDENAKRMFPSLDDYFFYGLRRLLGRCEYCGDPECID